MNELKWSLQSLLEPIGWCLEPNHCASFPGSSKGKASACNVGDPGSNPGLGRSPGEGNGNPLQYTCLGKFHGWRSLVGYSPWGHRESDRTERLHLVLVVLGQHDMTWCWVFDFLPGQSISVITFDRTHCPIGAPIWLSESLFEFQRTSWASLPSSGFRRLYFCFNFYYDHHF